MTAQPTQLAPELLKNTTSRDLGPRVDGAESTGKEPAVQSPPTRFGDRAPSCGKKRGRDTWDFRAAGAARFPDRWFMLSTPGPEHGELPL